jgi:hypothetical protein
MREGVPSYLGPGSLVASDALCLECTPMLGTHASRQVHVLNCCNWIDRLEVFVLEVLRVAVEGADIRDYLRSLNSMHAVAYITVLEANAAQLLLVGHPQQMSHSN